MKSVTIYKYTQQHLMKQFPFDNQTVISYKWIKVSIDAYFLLILTFDVAILTVYFFELHIGSYQPTKPRAVCCIEMPVVWASSLE